MTASRNERKAKVIAALNQARSMELYAIHQYMHQHYGLDNKDYGELAASMKLIAIDEMRHAESFAERVTELGGEPTTQLAAEVVKRQGVRDMYPFNAGTEDATIETYSDFLKVCNECGDSVSARLLERIIGEEQAHLSYFGNVGEHIDVLGDAYLSRIAGTNASTGPASKGFVLAQSAL